MLQTTTCRAACKSCHYRTFQSHQFSNTVNLGISTLGAYFKLRTEETGELIRGEHLIEGGGGGAYLNFPKMAPLESGTLEDW